MLDIDLSILGADPLRFMEYEYAIEEEFEKIPRLRFRIGRGDFLASLLARPTIFRTDSFRARYEAAARAQLSALLDSIRYRAFRLPAGCAGLEDRPRLLRRSAPVRRRNRSSIVVLPPATVDA